MDNVKKCFYYNYIEDIWQDTSCHNDDDDIEKRLRNLNISDSKFSYVYLPINWSIELIEKNILELILHTKRITLENAQVTEIIDKEWTIDCDINQGVVQGWPMSLLTNTERNWRNSYVCGSNITFPELLAARHVDIPVDVIDVAIGYLQDIAREKFKFRPSFLGDAHGLNHLIAFCESPLDPNICILKDVLGKDAYRYVLEQGRCNCFLTLCHFFRINNPPPSLRKAYITNPESILVYVYLYKCGFRDINIIRRFFYREELLGYRLLNFRYNAINGEFSSKNIYNNDLKNFQRFCLWLLRYRTEKAIAPRVLRWCNERLTTAASDTLRMFVAAQLDENDTLIDNTVRRQLLSDGLTREVHDTLVEEIFAVRPDIIPPHFYNHEMNYSNVVYNYTEKELSYSTVIAQYVICLPKDSNELRKWGNLFHNCVASYNSAVISKSTLILAMKEGEKYVACIEVRQNRIIQALGYCNQTLSLKHRQIISEWADANKIFYRNKIS